MLRKTLTSKILFLFLLLPSFITAQTQEYKDYTIEKGDTLWDISRKELSDSFLWPKVWKENPEIKNPDRIYLKQKIKIPLHLLQKEIKIPETKPKTELEIKPEKIEEKPVEEIIKPLKKEYLVNKNLLIASGYIAASAPYVGKIIDSPTDRTLLAKDDYAYIKTDNPAKKGEKFYVIRSVEKVTHPESGRKLGYLIEILGIAEVVDASNKVIIKDSYNEITTGSLLDNFYEIEPPLAIEPPRKPDINGYIVAARHLRIINGTWDIVYIDKGRKDGLEAGDIFTTMLKNKHEIANGLIQVINLRESTSTAIVRKSNDIISKGDEVTAVKQE
jgi:hypothetical protein